MLKSLFSEVTGPGALNQRLTEQLWMEIERAYTHPKRFYHTLQHLQHLAEELLRVRDRIGDWEATAWALFYHDIVYNPLRRDNEERSVVISENRMRTLELSESLISLCTDHILATKTHQWSSNGDTNFFTDADLSILGQPWPVYKKYAMDVRREYALYADNLYLQGRTAVLQHFLDRDRIFKTDHFHDRYEKEARQNLARELTNPLFSEAV